MMNEKGKVVAISKSEVKGVQKTNCNEAVLVEDHGIEGDAHAGKWHRQVSLLALESIEKMRAKGLEVSPGAFGENIATENLDLIGLELGEKLAVGEALLEITQKGKECHNPCAIYEQVGDCVMPREGVFARVLKGGTVRVGDAVLRRP
jgi:MOSC domain-containing protein YiiM